MRQKRLNETTIIIEAMSVLSLGNKGPDDNPFVPNFYSLFGNAVATSQGDTDNLHGCRSRNHKVRAMVALGSGLGFSLPIQGGQAV